MQITIAGGTLDIAAADDGLNANGYSGNSVINITGGETTVTLENGRDADGIDSNKDIYISDGKLFVSVSDNGGSCAIDHGSEYNGKCVISGGTVLACGRSGMAEGFDPSSTQGFLMQTASASAGTTVTVKDADGNELLSGKVPCSFSSVLVSTPEMKVGDTCRLIVGDTETEMTIDNAAAGGMQPPEMSNGAEGDMPSGLPQEMQENMPDARTNGDNSNNSDNNDNSDGTHSGIPQGGWNFGGRQGGDNMINPNGNMPGQENVSQAAAAGTPVSSETLILPGVSVIVLLAGCVFAACYKRRG